MESFTWNVFDENKKEGIYIDLVREKNKRSYATNLIEIDERKIGTHK